MKFHVYFIGVKLVGLYSSCTVELCWSRVGIVIVYRARPSSRSRNFRTRIFMKELTNQILLPGFRAVLTVHFQVNGGVYMLTVFASFLADSEGEEQDDGFLG